MVMSVMSVRSLLAMSAEPTMARTGSARTVQSRGNWTRKGSAMNKPKSLRMKMHEANRPPEYLQAYIADEMDEYLESLKADADRLAEALEDATKSLDTIARIAGKELLDDFISVRGYASNRAMVARAALAAHEDLGGTV
jgi:hypothetical protein